MEELSKIINVLKENNIKYTHKLIKLLKSSETISFRRIGINMDYETQYTVSVKANDYENAKYLVNKVLHSL